MTRDLQGKDVELFSQQQHYTEKLTLFKAKLDSNSTKLHDLKLLRRADNLTKSDAEKKLQGDMAYLRGCVDEMSKELQCSKRDAKKAFLRSKKSDGIASRRLEVVRELRVRVTVLNESLADESHQRVALERLCALRIDIKRERVVGRNGNGGTGRWPVRIVLLICELLVNGTAPRAVPANIRSVSETITGQPIAHSPSVNFVRQCRVVVQNLNEMLAAFCLGHAKKWRQIFTDGTSRRQVAFQNLVIGVLNGDEFESIIASSCIFLENETSAEQVEGIKKKVSVFVYYILQHTLLMYCSHNVDT